MRFSSIASSLVVALCCASGVTAAPANPNGHVYIQPDGSATPTLYLNGNQHYAWMSDSKGYTVVKDEQGWYVYGMKEEGDIISAGVRVGHSNPKKLGLIPQLQHDVELRRGLVHEHEEAEHRNLIAVPEKALCNFNGSKNSPCRLKGLVVLIKFADHGSRVLASSSEYDILFNNNGPTTNNIAPTGSVADVYLENSYDTFVLESVVSDWVTLSRTEAQAVDGDLGLNKPGTKAAWSEALTLAKKQFGNSYKQFDGDGDGAFDCLVMMHSGTASETGGIDVETAGDYKTRIWSHATTSEWYKDNEIKVGRFYVASGLWDIAPPGGKGTKWDLARIAVIAHECAHFLGLPDLYDTTGGSGAGTFDLLANMWGWYGDQLYPPLMSAWSKMQLGWVRVVDVKAATTSVNILASCEGDIIYKISYGLKNGEYFLVENRYPCGFDAKLAHHKGVDKDRGGIAIWHIDETDLLGAGKITYQSEGVCSGGQCAQHYRVALVQSDGNFDLEKGVNKGDGTDLFRKRSEAAGALQGWKIDDNGVTLNNGSVKADTNTQGYAGTVRYKSGITIEVGAYEKNMAVTIKLAGATGMNSDAISSLKSVVTATVATPLPTAAPTLPPTVAPTVAPTLPPTVAPTLPPTVAPTLPPTVASTLPPTVAPTPPPPTVAPTVAPTPTPPTASCIKPSQAETGGYGCPSTETLPMTCDNLSTQMFLVTGVGNTPSAQLQFKTKRCRDVEATKQSKFCNKLDYSKTDSTTVNHPYVWQICQKECSIQSKCPP